MNLTIGCKEKTDKGWIYSLREGGRSMTQKEWWSLVQAEIHRRGHEEIYQRILDSQGSKRWFEQDTAKDFALQIYAAKYCTNIGNMQSMTGKVQTKQVASKSISSNQLSLI